LAIWIKIPRFGSISQARVSTLKRDFDFNVPEHNSGKYSSSSWTLVLAEGEHFGGAGTTSTED
jgi:hypothetical protein